MSTCFQTVWCKHLALQGVLTCCANRMTNVPKAGTHGDLYAPNWTFSRNTALKTHGRREPCRGFLPCLAEKFLTLECFAVLKVRFLFTGTGGDRRNTLCISRSSAVSVGKKMPSKPCKSLCAPAYAYAFGLLAFGAPLTSAACQKPSFLTS